QPATWPRPRIRRQRPGTRSALAARAGAAVAPAAPRSRAARPDREPSGLSPQSTFRLSIVRMRPPLDRSKPGHFTRTRDPDGPRPPYRVMQRRLLRRTCDLQAARRHAAVTVARGGKRILLGVAIIAALAISS